MKTFLLILVTSAVSFSFSLSAQQLNRDPSQLVMGGTSSLQNIQTKEAEVRVVGDFYLFDSFMQAEIYMKSGKVLSEVPINYDLKTKELIISKVENYLLVPIVNVEEIEIKQSGEKFINSKNIAGLEPNRLTVAGLEPNGLLRVLSDESRWSLYESVNVEMVKPYYNEALDIGSRDLEIKKSQSYVYHRKDSKEVTQFEKPKKFVKSIDDSGKLKSYIKGEGLQIDKERDLILLLKYYDSIY